MPAVQPLTKSVTGERARDAQKGVILTRPGAPLHEPPADFFQHPAGR